MQIRFAPTIAADAAVLALPIASGGMANLATEQVGEAGLRIVRAAAAGGRFEGEAGGVPRVSSSATAACAASSCSASAPAARMDWEKAGGALTARLLTSGVEAVTVDLSTASPSAVEAARFAAAASQRGWRHDAYRTKLADKQKPTLATITLAGAPDGAEAAWYAQEAVTRGMALTRALVAEPANLLYPESFVEQVTKSVEGMGLEITVLDEEAMRGFGMGALLGVSQGSVRRCAHPGAEMERGRRGRSGARAGGQGRHLRYRRHHDQARGRHGRHEVGHGRRRRGGRRNEGDRRSQGESERDRRLRSRREHAGRQCAAAGRYRHLDVGADDRGHQHRGGWAAGARRRHHLGAADASSQDDRRSRHAHGGDDRRARQRTWRAVLERRCAGGPVARGRQGVGRQVVAVPARRQLQQADRFADRGHDERRPARRRLDHRGAVHQAVRRRRRPAGRISTSREWSGPTSRAPPTTKGATGYGVRLLDRFVADNFES